MIRPMVLGVPPVPGLLACRESAVAAAAPALQGLGGHVRGGHEYACGGGVAKPPVEANPIPVVAVAHGRSFLIPRVCGGHKAVLFRLF
jgi:hypothetical protein